VYINTQSLNILNICDYNVTHAVLSQFTAGVEGLFALDHTQTHTTVCMAPLDEGSALRRDLYLPTQTL
jgi:hypothetical protein